METIYYKYTRIELDQFAIFEENISEMRPEHKTNMSTEFNYDWQSNELCNVIVITIGDDSAPILKASMKSYFLISNDSVAQITNEQGDLVFQIQPLIQFASLNYGSLRGALHLKTQGSKLSNLVLPPLYFNEIIKKNLIVKNNEQ